MTARVDQELRARNARRRRDCLSRVARSPIPAPVAKTLSYILESIGSATDYTLAWRSHLAMAEALGCSERAVERHCRAIAGSGLLTCRKLGCREARALLRDEFGHTMRGVYPHLLCFYAINGDHPFWSAGPGDTEAVARVVAAMRVALSWPARRAAKADTGDGTGRGATAGERRHTRRANADTGDATNADTSGGRAPLREGTVAPAPFPSPGADHGEADPPSGGERGGPPLAEVSSPGGFDYTKSEEVVTPPAQSEVADYSGTTSPDLLRRLPAHYAALALAAERQVASMGKALLPTESDPERTAQRLSERFHAAEDAAGVALNSDDLFRFLNTKRSMRAFAWGTFAASAMAKQFTVSIKSSAKARVESEVQRLSDRETLVNDYRASALDETERPSVREQAMRSLLSQRPVPLTDAKVAAFLVSGRKPTPPQLVSGVLVSLLAALTDGRVTDPGSMAYLRQSLRRCQRVFPGETELAAECLTLIGGAV